MTTNQTTTTTVSDEVLAIMYEQGAAFAALNCTDRYFVMDTLVRRIESNGFESAFAATLASAGERGTGSAAARHLVAVLTMVAIDAELRRDPDALPVIASGEQA